jgi:hypothetical protein
MKDNIKERGNDTVSWIVLIEDSVQCLLLTFRSNRRGEFRALWRNYQRLKEDLSP